MLKHKAFKAATAQIAQMHKPKPDEVNLVAEGLLGGFGGHYFSAKHVTWKQCAEVEAAFRAVYNYHAKHTKSTLQKELYCCTGVEGVEKHHNEPVRAGARF